MDEEKLKLQFESDTGKRVRVYQNGFTYNPDYVAWLEGLVIANDLTVKLNEMIDEVNSKHKEKLNREFVELGTKFAGLKWVPLVNPNQTETKP